MVCFVPSLSLSHTVLLQIGWSMLRHFEDSLSFFTAQVYSPQTQLNLNDEIYSNHLLPILSFVFIFLFLTLFWVSAFHLLLLVAIFFSFSWQYKNRMNFEGGNSILGNVTQGNGCKFFGICKNSLWD